MKKYSFLLILSVLFLASACTDSFFDLEPSDKVPKDKIYKTAADFNIAVVGCYAKMQSQVSFYTECSEYRSDNMVLLAPTTGTQDRYDIDQFKETAANGLLDNYWANFNNQVYRCNLILDQIDGVDFDANLKNQYKAEALFLRAYTYFNMFRVWGGVPITRKVVDVKEALSIGRSTEQEMYDLIVGDLQVIVDNNMLPTSYRGDDVGRITLGAAQSLLGKVYLTFKKPLEASKVLEQVLGKYSLQDQPGDVFDVDNKMNSEIIFAVRFNKNLINKEGKSEGHGYWFAINNPANAENPSPQLLSAYSDPADKRKDLISYTQVESNQYVLKKFYDTKSATTNTVGNDQILIRYADVLLMYAEALNEVAYSNLQSSPALKALNEVRTRAGLQPLEISSLPNKDAFRKAILIERQLEFPFEGHRWFDLVRMGYAKEVMAESGHIITESQLLFPIPKSVIERVNNMDLVWQNPGYN